MCRRRARGAADGEGGGVVEGAAATSRFPPSIFGGVPPAAHRPRPARGAGTHLSRISQALGRLRGSFVRRNAVRSELAQPSSEDI